MSDRMIQFRLGLFALIGAALLYFFAIPSFVSSPSNVPNIVLSPLFWPQFLAGIAALIGVGLIALSGRSSADMPEPDVDLVAPAYLRLALMAVIMGAVMFGIPRLGLVWTCVLAFAASAFLVRTKHRFAALVSAVLVPLALYFFFAHVAGVAIPQGNFVRLP